MFGRSENKGADLARIQQAVQSAGTTHGVRNLTVRQTDTAFEIHGVADNVSAKQQAMKAITQKVGDTAGLVNRIDVAREEPVSPMQPPPIPNQPQAAVRTHTVKKGETLSHIARHYYGKASEYRKIFDANRNQLSDPDRIREGMTLKIPN